MEYQYRTNHIYLSQQLTASSRYDITIIICSRTDTDWDRNATAHSIRLVWREPNGSTASGKGKLWRDLLFFFFFFSKGKLWWAIYVYSILNSYLSLEGLFFMWKLKKKTFELLYVSGGTLGICFFFFWRSKIWDFLFYFKIWRSPKWILGWIIFFPKTGGWWVNFNNIYDLIASGNGNLKPP